MDEATQKLVAEARGIARSLRAFQPKPGEWASGGVHNNDHKAGVVDALADALEAAQRPSVAEPDNHHNADVCPFCTRNRDEREAAIRAEAIAQRPPVSPEAREAMVKALEEAASLPLGVIEDGEEHWASYWADAILARFSLPSQPVYDEEKIARFLWGQVGDAEPSSAWRPVAAALVAALRGGELTREEGQ